MAKYNSKRTPKLTLARRYRQRDPYHSTNLYKLPNIYNQRQYKSRTNPYTSKIPSKTKGGTRRGYKSRLYNPRRRTQSSSLMPKYRPVPKQSSPKSIHWPEPKHYKLPQPRTEPDAEQLLKQLEKRFDKKLHEQVLEKLEAEFEKLQETLAKERAEREELEEMRGKQIEAWFEEHGDELTERFLLGDIDNPEPIESIEADGGEKVETQETKAEPNSEAEIKNELDDELQNKDELYEVYDELEWLREHETEPPEVSEENELIEPRQTIDEQIEPIEPIETLADQEIIEPAVEINEPIEIPIEESVELEPEQLADLEPLLDKIELLEALEPIESIEAFPELTKAMEEEAIEAEAY